jgi:hypothetical protein
MYIAHSELASEQNIQTTQHTTTSQQTKSKANQDETTKAHTTTIATLTYYVTTPSPWHTTAAHCNHCNAHATITPHQFSGRKKLLDYLSNHVPTNNRHKFTAQAIPQNGFIKIPLHTSVYNTSTQITLDLP